MKLPTQLPSLQIFLGSHPPHPSAGWLQIQPWESKQALKVPTEAEGFQHLENPAPSGAPTLTHQQTTFLLPSGGHSGGDPSTVANEFMVAVRNRTHLTCWAATHTAAQSLPVSKAWLSRGTRSLPPTQHLLTHLRAVLPTSTQESPHFPVPEVWPSNSSVINPLPQPELLLLPQWHMNVQYFLQSSCSPENKFQLGLMKHFIQHGKGKGGGGG